jgi:hypothetical protein
MSLFSRLGGTCAHRGVTDQVPLQSATQMPCRSAFCLTDLLAEEADIRTAERGLVAQVRASKCFLLLSRVMRAMVSGTLLPRRQTRRATVLIAP